jgi:hypothetical protein
VRAPGRGSASYSFVFPIEWMACCTAGVHHNFARSRGAVLGRCCEDCVGRRKRQRRVLGGGARMKGIVSAELACGMPRGPLTHGTS